MASNTSSSNEKRWSQRVANQLEDFFGIDLRTLAIVRIVAAITVLWTLAILFQDAEIFFTDNGVYPREYWLDTRNRTYTVSFHMIRGELWWQYLLFGAQAVFALMMLVGYKTRFASIMTWILLVSLFHRNIVIAHRGDTLLCLLVLWGALTPWGARFSIDGALNTVRDLPRRVTTFATAGLILQMPLVYFVSVILKFEHRSWLPDMSAVAYSMSPEYVTPIGQFVAEHTPFVVTQAFTVFTLLVEGVGPLLMFLPLLIFVSRNQRQFWLSRLRLVAIGAITLMQLGLLLTVAVGLFPLISTLGLLAALPDSVWERWSKSARVKKARNIVLYYDPDCAFCRKMVLLIRQFFLPAGSKIVPASEKPDIYEQMQEENSWVIAAPDHSLHTGFDGFLTIIEHSPWAFIAHIPLRRLHPLGDRLYRLVANNRPFMGRFTRGLDYRAYHVKPGLFLSGLSALLFASMITANIDSVHNSRVGHWETPSEIRDIQWGLRIHQNWRMFVSPYTWSNYYVVHATLKNGTEVDLYDGGPISADSASPLTWEPPSELRSYEIYENYRWRLYLQSVRTDSFERDRRHYAAYMCRTWNRHHQGDDQLDHLRFYRMVRTRDLLTEPMAEEADKILLWRHWCFGRPDDK